MSVDQPRDDARRLLRGTLTMQAVLTPPLAIGGALAAGWNGAIAAIIGVGFVLLLFGGSTALLLHVLKTAPLSSVGVLAGGALARLFLYAAALVGLAQVSWLHRPSLAIATAVAVAVTLAYEMRALSRMPRLFWVDASAGGPTSVPNAATRS